MEGLRKTLKDLRMTGILPKISNRHFQNTSLDNHTAKNYVGVKYKYIWGFYKEQNLVKLKYIYVHLNVTSILLNAVVAVSRLSHMPCFVQPALTE